jgi:hypothetical protein
MRIVSVAAVALLLVACGAAEPGASGAEPEQPATPEPANTPAPLTEPATPAAANAPRSTSRPAAPRPPTGTRLPRPAAPSPPAQSSPAAAAGEVPATILDRLIADLVERAGVDRAAVAVARSEAVTWNDGSLGCAQPGVNYTQAQVAGYRVILRANGRDYDYRVGVRGGFVLCDRPRLRTPPGAGTPKQ